MPGVILHVFGEAFDPRPVLAGMSLEPYEVYCKGDLRFPDSPRSEKRHGAGGFKCNVSNSDGVMAEEERDTVDFLRRHYADLARLGNFVEIEAKYLDFGYYLRIDMKTVVIQCDYLGPELLRLAGELGIGIELSLYPRSEEPAECGEGHAAGHAT